MAPNPMGGISVLKYNALLYHYTTSLVETGSLLTTGLSGGTGFGMKGDLFAVIGTNALILYKMNAGGGSATQVARLDYRTDHQTSAPVKCLGFSENAFVSPINNLPINPPVFSRTLKVQR
ncbi:hypothetical protein ACIQ6U_17210 [Lysinibacillus fusiformis]|uniref:hypothetical protein n=1 Tax=Lysinibacillus fusiformis TaxID=28031 RepID=UPI00382391C9